MTDKSRYPGVKPFETDDQNVFFGRSRDISILFDLIRIEKTLLLYSKSGLGKTSLINAGLIPQFINAGDYNIFTIRLGVYSETNFIPPRKKVIGILKANIADSPLLALPELMEDSISYWLKAIQISDPEKTNLLIFDQFEELFTYPDEQIGEFARELYEVIYLKTSSSFRDNLIRLWEKNPGALSKDQFNELSSAVNIRFVFAIRSDFLSMLNRLTNYLPNLQRTFYELKPLEIEDAKHAIIEPAVRLGDFSTFEFEYTTETVDKIINELSDHSIQPIETFQLQIVCQYAENIVSKDPTHLIITPDDLGEINDIHQRFYDTLISDLPVDKEEERIKIRILIEEEFIYAPEQRRVQVLKGKLLNRITEQTLSAIEKTHLIRSEPYQNTFTYELSHDTLVEPILKSYHQRIKEEEAKKEAEQKEKAERIRQDELKAIQQKSRRQRNIIVMISIAALVSVGFAIFGFAMWQKAVREKKKAQNLFNSLEIEQKNSRKAKFDKYILEGNTLKNDANYLEAIQRYRMALEFEVIDTFRLEDKMNASFKNSYGSGSEYLIGLGFIDTISVKGLIEFCKSMSKQKDRFQKLIQEGNDLQQNENTYAEAMQKYNEALSLNFDNNTVQLQIYELNLKIDSAVKKFKYNARIYIDAKACDEALPILQKARHMKPSDGEIRQLMQECK